MTKTVEYWMATPNSPVVATAERNERGWLIVEGNFKKLQTRFPQGTEFKFVDKKVANYKAI